MLSAIISSAACNSAYAQHAELPDVNSNCVNRSINPVAYRDYKKQIPQKIQDYKWENEEWMIQKTYVYEYNDMFKINNLYETNYYDGYVSEYVHYAFEYDDMQRISRVTECYRYSSAEEWLNSQISEYTYDSMVPDFAIKEDIMEWDELCEVWMRSLSSSYTEIKRDENNRVVSKILWDSDRKKKAYKACYYEYDDETGPAVKMRIEEINENDELVPKLYYYNMVWEKSNCQYVDEYDNMYFVWTKDSENKIKSMTICTYDDSQNIIYNSDIECLWDEKGRKQYIAIYSANGFNKLNSYQYDIRDNGGYDYTYSSWEDTNDNHRYDEGEEVFNKKARTTHYNFDEYGNMTCEESIDYNESAGAFDKDSYKNLTTYVYMDDGTLQEQETVKYKEGIEFKREKTVYSDFINPVPTAIDDTYDNEEIFANGMPYAVYDMNGTVCRQGTVTDAGIRLEELPHGVYVVRSGSHAIKMVR